MTYSIEDFRRFYIRCSMRYSEFLQLVDNPEVLCIIYQVSTNSTFCALSTIYAAITTGLSSRKKCKAPNQTTNVRFSAKTILWTQYNSYDIEC